MQHSEHQQVFDRNSIAIKLIFRIITTTGLNTKKNLALQFTTKH